jgi:hypothetical protein
MNWLLIEQESRPDPKVILSKQSGLNDQVMTGRDTHKDKMMLKGKLGRLSNDANIKW